MGLLVEARMSGSNAASYGTFSTNGDTDIQTLACFGQANSAICHANSNPKLVKSFLWTPPATINSPIEITATVLQSYTTFWTGVKTTTDVCAALNVTDAAASSSSSTTQPITPPDRPSSTTPPPRVVPSTSRRGDRSQDDSADRDDQSSERGRSNARPSKTAQKFGKPNRKH
jgi:hypothetical protein